MLIILFWILISLGIATLSIWLGEKYGLGLLIGIYGGLVVASQILANRIVMFGDFQVPAAVIAYSITFLITDALVEFNGKKKAKEAVWSGFLASIFLVVLLQITFAWKPAFPQEHFIPALSQTWRIVVASLVAYLLSANWDVWLFSKIKEKTGKKMLWLRNCGSTLTSQLIDTVAFITIGFAGVMPIIPLIIGQYVVKLIIALMDTPFLYFIDFLKRKKIID